MSCSIELKSNTSIEKSRTGTEGSVDGSVKVEGSRTYGAISSGSSSNTGSTKNNDTYSNNDDYRNNDGNKDSISGGFISGNTRGNSAGSSHNNDVNASSSTFNSIDRNVNHKINIVQNNIISNHDESYLLILQRRVLQDGEIGGAKIGKGDRVLISLERDYDSRGKGPTDTNNAKLDKYTDKANPNMDKGGTDKDIEDLIGIQRVNTGSNVVRTDSTNRHGTNIIDPNPVNINGLILLEPNIAVGKDAWLLI
jgi:hypothetical protein